MVEVSRDMIGLDAASSELDKLIAADAASTDSPAAGKGTEQSAKTEGQRAAPTEETQTETTKQPDSLSTEADTRAAAEAAAKSPKTETQKTPEQIAAEKKEPSRYEKARDRRDTTWQKINEEKAALKAERDRFDAERAEFTQTRQQAEAQYSPDQYDAAAKKFEEQGKFDLADLAKSRAKELRDNPPPTPQQAQVQRQQADQHQAAMKEWWGKAAVDYPNVARTGTPESTALKTFLTAEPEAVRSPKGMYYAARLVSAETTSARVPAMEKELGDLRAKVKELEALTSPGGASIPSRAAGQGAERSESQELADLERLATELGPLR